MTTFMHQADSGHRPGAQVLGRRAATRNRVPLPQHGKPIGPLHPLTAREQEVLALLANEATDKGIAAALVISTGTASIHVGSIRAKLQVPNGGAAAKLARTSTSSRAIARPLHLTPRLMNPFSRTAAAVDGPA
jgi:DNA-binding NarL/FixJ family response regulator